MTIHVHHLTGCSPAPLAHYLKAFGVLRLVAEQKDAAARGWWKDEAFHIATTLDEEALLRFFLEEYRPTPVVAPWNGGSGFYPKDKKNGIDAIAQSPAARLSVFRDVIVRSRSAVSGLNESPKNHEKAMLLRRIRNDWRGPSLEWMEAAVVLDGGGDPAYPALLGTGGNDGRLDFTNNFMQRLAELFDCTEPAMPAFSATERLLAAALFERPEEGLGRNAVGQFLPGGVGGANASTGFVGEMLLNPWDFVLMIEGAVLFRSAVSRQLRVRDLPRAAAPFAVAASAVGYGSIADSDKNRGEQWFLLWARPATLAEIRAVVAEGRSQIGRRTAGQPVDFGRAVARLGVARGITAFQRFGYIERNGQANLAVPLGRWQVQAQPHQDLLDEVDDWVDRLRRAGSDKNAPAGIDRAARNAEEAMLACCRDGRNPRRWQDLLAALGHAERQLTRSPRFTAAKRLQPLPSLGGGWLRAADDGGAELRLALALASQHGLNAGGELDWREPVRRHFLPLDRSGRRFEVRGEMLADSAGVVCNSEDLSAVALALLRRRVVEAGQAGLARLPLSAVPGAEASLDDIARLLAGELDEGKILDLARPLMALDWRRFQPPFRPRPSSAEILGSLGLFGLLRLAHWPRPLRLAAGAKPVSIPLDPTILSRLATGDLPRAAEAAIRRLSASGLRPHLRKAVGTPDLAGRLALALAFPIRERDAVTLAHRLTRPTLEEYAGRRDEASVHPAHKETTTP